jgi:surface antigen
MALHSRDMASTSAPQAVPPAGQPALRLQPPELVLIAGLAGVFIVNSIVAAVDPSDVRALVERSLVGRVIPAMHGRWIAWAVAANDVTIGAVLLATTWKPRARPFVLAWAGAWLFAVALVKLTSLEALGGRPG